MGTYDYESRALEEALEDDFIDRLHAYLSREPQFQDGVPIKLNLNSVEIDADTGYCSVWGEDDKRAYHFADGPEGIRIDDTIDQHKGQEIISHKKHRDGIPM